jgi:hypothetical protein
VYDKNIYLSLFQNLKKPVGRKGLSGNPFGVSQKIGAESPVFCPWGKKRA